MAKVYLSLGSNLGDRCANLRKAIQLLEQQAGHVCALSSFHETEPWGFSSENGFLNAVCLVSTSLPPLRFLDVAQDIERQMGRTEKTTNGVYHDRIIDIDILLYDEVHMHTERLTLPHPLMEKREFVMRPLLEIYGQGNVDG